MAFSGVFSVQFVVSASGVPSKTVTITNITATSASDAITQALTQLNVQVVPVGVAQTA